MARIRYRGAKAYGSLHLAAQPTDGDTYTVGTKTYEFDDDASVTAGNVSVTIGADAEESMENLEAAINANKPEVPVTASIDTKNATGDTIRLVADQVGTRGNMALAKSGAQLSVSGAAMVGGENAGLQVQARGAYTVVAADVQADNIEIETGLQSPRFARIECRDTNGLEKVLTALLTIDGSKIRLNFAGATDPAATDVITWEAWE